MYNPELRKTLVSKCYSNHLGVMTVILGEFQKDSSEEFYYALLIRLNGHERSLIKIGEETVKGISSKLENLLETNPTPKEIINILAN